jgi:hypothetical protein
MQINSNNYSVIEILEMLEQRKLIVNRDYQRGGGLWPDAPSAYFIDTILEGFTFPKIYVYEFMERSSRSLRKEIVDGQQRIGAIERFYGDKFVLRSDGPNKGKKYSELDMDTQEKFLQYSVPVDVIRNASIAEILQMFRRMNAYTLPLNEAEKRHSSYHGLFKWFVNGIADENDEFFVEFGVLTRKQITRMADAALISDIVLALERGVISSSPADLSSLYKKYDLEFDVQDDYRTKLVGVFSFIVNDLGELRNTFMMKPYALHSLATALLHCKFGVNSISEEWGVATLNAYSTNTVLARSLLRELADAHEGKDVEGPHAKYVWGCMSTTDRKARRTARVAAILRALGATVPDVIDANLT